MKHNTKQQIKTSYLDVTQFIIKECSPLIKPNSPKLISNEQKVQKTPQINPIQHDMSKFAMTPFYKGLCKHPDFQITDQFILEGVEGVEGFELQVSIEKRSKNERNLKVRQPKLKKSSFPEIYFPEDSLNMILEVQYEQDGIIVSGQQYSEQDQQIDSQSYNESFYTEIHRISNKQQYNEHQSTIDISGIEFNDAIERFKQNPKKQIVKQMKEIQNTMPEESPANKKNMIKKLIEKYLLDYEIYCYEEAWKQLELLDLNQMIKKINQGLTQTFNKKIGVLPFQVRRTKILKYLEKKKKRIWRKKVSYDCRKKVADGRLRIKGKFVTRQQACQQLGVTNLDGYTSQEIKYMLQRRLDNRD